MLGLVTIILLNLNLANGKSLLRHTGDNITKLNEIIKKYLKKLTKHPNSGLGSFESKGMILN